jgi:hypothetical protein
LISLKPTALHLTAKYCCDHHPERSFSLQDLLPGLIFESEPVPEVSTRKHAKPRAKYRPVAQRGLLDYRLAIWLKDAHDSDLLRAVRPASLILSPTNREILTKTRIENIKSAKDMTKILDKTEEWHSEWAVKIFQVIQDYEHDWKALAVKNGSHLNRPLQKKKRQ